MLETHVFSKKSADNAVSIIPGNKNRYGVEHNAVAGFNGTEYLI